jgi:uncharacterized protein YdeI (BOF family)
MGLLKSFNNILAAIATMALMACHSAIQLNAKEGGLPAIDSLARTNTIQAAQKYVEPGKVVHLKGKVGKKVPLLGGAAYELKDSTGTIWVLLTGGSAPPPGTEIVIQGKLRYQTISINQQDQGTAYIEQQKQVSKE